MKKKHLLAALALWMLAVALRFLIAPALERLPRDYATEIRLDTQSRFRESPDAEWETLQLTGRRVDQTLLSDPEYSIIQADLHWTDDRGVVAYKNSGIYGVDRRTRANLPGYGNVSRTGSFMFPLHMEQKTYPYWDPSFQGERLAAFERTDNLGGLPVYVFRFVINGLDESEGYSQLPGVPNRYKALTDAAGTIWVEPVSGKIIDYEEKGESILAAVDTGKQVGSIYLWGARYGEQTRTAKREEAITMRRRIHMLEIWLPLGFLAAGALWLLPVWRRSAPSALRAAGDGGSGS
ncbi:MAG: hypothetical protein JWQ00_182 [Noviherbaspirillum sp.]|nr:hypothetical protein [Noviherbaspirillum sp.]